MRGALARQRVALRIARRSALTSWGRSLLIVLLIAVPIAGLAGAAVLVPSSRPTQREQVENTLGRAQAELMVVAPPGSGVHQGLFGGYDFTGGGSSTADADVDPRTVLPTGTRVLAIGSGAAVFRTPAGSASLAVTTGPSWDPVLDHGPYALLSGRRPRADDEVLVSPAALDHLGARVGGTIRMLTPEARMLRIVGTSRDRLQPATAQTVFGATGLVPDAVPATFFVPSTPIGWAEVRRLNRAGITAFSRAVIADPPAGVRADFHDSDLTPSVLILVLLGAAFALLEVALLAGAAFLVGARLQQRALATVATVGADRGVLHGIVLASGTVLGIAGGLLGTAVGVAGAAILMRATDDGSWTRWPGFHLSWPLLAAIVLFGVVVGWLAALVPARAASRFDVVRALRGARTPQRIRARRPVVGVFLAGAGVVMTLAGGTVLFGALRTRDDGTLGQLGGLGLLGGGSVLTQLGAILCAGLLLRGVTRLLARAPLGVRLGARDTSRNLGRTVPALAAVMTTVFLASFAMCIANTAAEQADADYSWSVPRVGAAESDIGVPADADRATAAGARAWRATLTSLLPVAHSAVLEVTREGTDSATPSNRTRDALPIVRFPHDAVCTARSARDVHDAVCGPWATSRGNSDPAVAVGGPEALALLLGHAPSAAALRTLADGGAVALRSDLAPGGRTAIDWFTPKQLSTGDPSTLKPRRTTRLDAVVDLPAHPLPTAVLVSASTAARLGMDPVPTRVLLDFTRPPTDAELDRADAALGALVNQPNGTWLLIEHGPNRLGPVIAWSVLLASLIIAVAAGATAIGLARIDARADDATLASLGAARRIRRTVAAAQAVVVCGVGAVIGGVLGLLPAVAIGGATQSFPFSPPPVQLVLLIAGIPVVIAAGSWLLTGTRRTDLTRRAAIA